MASNKEIDVFNVSFIDLLSCALGGVLLIFFMISGLVQDGVRKALSTSKSSGGRYSVETALFDGKEVPPPAPLLITLTVDGPTSNPVEMEVIVPGALQGDKGSVLSESQPVMEVGGTRYRALFSRSLDGDGNCVLTAMIPNSRSLARDIASGALEPSINGWKVQVGYPARLSESQEHMKDDLVHKWRNLSKMAISLAVFDAGKESGSGKASVSWKRIEWRTNGTNQFAAIAGNQLGTIGTSKATELKLPSDKLAFVTSHSSFLTRQGLASADFETVFNQLLDEFHLLNLEAPEDDAFFQLIDLSARLAEIVNSLDRGWDNPDVVRFLQAVQ